MRVIWAALGILCVGIGLLGVVLPLLPTVPFMLLAAFFFARSSERLHVWLITHPTFGGPFKTGRKMAPSTRGPKSWPPCLLALFS